MLTTLALMITPTVSPEFAQAHADTILAIPPALEEAYNAELPDGFPENSRIYMSEMHVQPRAELRSTVCGEFSVGVTQESTGEVFYIGRFRYIAVAQGGAITALHLNATDDEVRGACVLRGEIRIGEYYPEGGVYQEVMDVYRDTIAR